MKNIKKKLHQFTRSTRLIILLVIICVVSCTKQITQKTSRNADTKNTTLASAPSHNDIEKLNAKNISPETFHAHSLPQKQNPESMFMSESPITPQNIDSYLFRKDCIYVDLRSSQTFYSEGHIAGFTNIPFYNYIAGYPNDKKPLFKMTRKDGVVLGTKGSFVANYEESESIIFETFPKDKNIIAISTAGVESCYLLNLLFQLGYSAEKLYNVGSFTNGMGSDIAYRTYKNAQHLVKGMPLVDTHITHTFSSLTPVPQN